MTEEWRTVSDFPDYEVSSEGAIRSYKRHHVPTQLKPMMSGRNRNRLQVTLSTVRKNSVNRYVSRIVAQAFIPGFQGEEVHFYNGDPLDCRASNLYFVRGATQYDVFGKRRVMGE